MTGERRERRCRSKALLLGARMERSAPAWAPSVATPLPAKVQQPILPADPSSDDWNGFDFAAGLRADGDDDGGWGAPDGHRAVDRPPRHANHGATGAQTRLRARRAREPQHQ